MNTVMLGMENMPNIVSLKTLRAGTYVHGTGVLKDEIYIVVNNSNYPSMTGINVRTGGYVTSDTQVIPLASNTQLTLRVNMEEI
jgi:hypothetical protein